MLRKTNQPDQYCAVRLTAARWLAADEAGAEMMLYATAAAHANRIDVDAADAAAVHGGQLP